MNIGDRIKENRLKKVLTQDQLAQLLNVSRSTVSSWEVGRNYPDLDTVISICDLFDLSLDSLLRDDKEMTKDVSQKLKMNRYYNILLIVIGLIISAYLSIHTTSQMNEIRYRHNLTAYGWEIVHSPNFQDRQNEYELKEDNITYWINIMPTGLIDFPIYIEKPNIIANKDGFVVSVENDNHFRVSNFRQNDDRMTFDISVRVDKDGQLIKKYSPLSNPESDKVDEYLKKYKEIHVELINKSIEKRQEIIGSFQK